MVGVTNAVTIIVDVSVDLCVMVNPSPGVIVEAIGIMPVLVLPHGTNWLPPVCDEW